jgi:hypothetical protein
MSREVIVFNRREVPLNILMDELAQRGSPGTWKAMLSSESESTCTPQTVAGRK